MKDPNHLPPALKRILSTEYNSLKQAHDLAQSVYKMEGGPLGRWGRSHAAHAEHSWRSLQKGLGSITSGCLQDDRLWGGLLLAHGNCGKARRREASLPQGMPSALFPVIYAQWQTLQASIALRAMLTARTRGHYS